MLARTPLSSRSKAIPVQFSCFKAEAGLGQAKPVSAFPCPPLRPHKTNKLVVESNEGPGLALPCMRNSLARVPSFHYDYV